MDTVYNELYSRDTDGAKRLIASESHSALELKTVLNGGKKLTSYVKDLGSHACLNLRDEQISTNNNFQPTFFQSTTNFHDYKLNQNGIDGGWLDAYFRVTLKNNYNATITLIQSPLMIGYHELRYGGNKIKNFESNYDGYTNHLLTCLKWLDFTRDDTGLRSLFGMDNQYNGNVVTIAAGATATIWIPINTILDKTYFTPNKLKSGDLLLRVYPPNYSITTTGGASNANITLNEMSLFVRYLETDQKEYNSVLNFSMNNIRFNNLTFQTEEFTFNGQNATTTPFPYKILSNKERWGPGILFVTIYNGQQGSNSNTLYDFVAPSGISQLYVQTDNNKKYTTNQDVFFTPTELLAKATYLFKTPFFNYNYVYPICICPDPGSVIRDNQRYGNLKLKENTNLVIQLVGGSNSNYTCRITGVWYSDLVLGNDYIEEDKV